MGAGAPPSLDISLPLLSEVMFLSEKASEALVDITPNLPEFRFPIFLGSNAP